MIFKVIKNVLIDELGLEEKQVTENAFIGKDLLLDSTETVAIALALKKHFGVKYVFPQEDVTISQIIKFVASHVVDKV